MAIEIGRICIKTRGREKGRKCVVVDLIDKNYVLITGPKSITGVKRRRVNIDHLKPTLEKLKVNRGASDESVEAAVKDEDKMELMKEGM